MSVTNRVSRLGVALAGLAAAFPAAAALKDRGPVNPATGFPTWYRDNGIPAAATPAVPPQALEICLAATPSIHPLGGGAPMCFPVVPDPTGFPGNFGDEAFYAVADATLTGPFGSATLVTALEAAYFTGAPVRGQEMVFARIRLIIDVNPGFEGTYVVTHPFGVEIFPGVTAGNRAVTFTEDIGAAALQFDGSLAGRVGPFLRWDSDTQFLTITTAAGVEEYLGDPNVPHTVTGSPFGTNFLQIQVFDASGNLIDAPPPQPEFTVVGKKYLQPIPTPLKIARATYSRDASNSSIDVFAQANPGQQLVLSGTGIANTFMSSNPAGGYLGHVVLAPDALLPQSVVVSNTTDVPPSVFTAAVTDLVTITDAVYDPAGGTLTVSATSSDASAAPPALAVSGLGPMVAGVFTSTTAGPVPPESVTVVSSAGGSASRPVRLLLTGGGGAPSANVAVNDAVSTSFNTAVTFDVIAGAGGGADTIHTPVAAVILTSPPQHGTVVPGAALGQLVYTPAVNYSGPDAFAYVLQDATGALSNVATVAVTVVFVPVAPTANADTAATSAGVAVAIPLLANDTAAVGTTILPGTVALGPVAPAGAGTLTWSAASGLATFTPAVGFSGTATASYTVQNNFAQTSAPAAITINVAPAPDVINIIRAQYRTSIGQWRVDGTSTSTAAGTTVTIYNGSTTAAPVLATNVPVVAGAFTWTSPNGAPAPSANRLILIRSSAGGSRVAAVTVRQ